MRCLTLNGTRNARTQHFIVTEKTEKKRGRETKNRRKTRRKKFIVKSREKHKLQTRITQNGSKKKNDFDLLEWKLIGHCNIRFIVLPSRFWFEKLCANNSSFPHFSRGRKIEIMWKWTMKKHAVASHNFSGSENTAKREKKRERMKWKRTVQLKQFKANDKSTSFRFTHKQWRVNVAIKMGKKNKAKSAHNAQ